ncbi:MAG: hypothetical protein EP301_03330 [Gammaproteobacteria bacterium]|nr:MAG: hypothetical protein EP301_03330 [Gammaproteobacteria bacterium]
MHRLQAALLGLLMLCSATVQAERYNHFDPRAHTDLDQVVALCATEPGSQRFDQAWQGWLAANPEADVYLAVETVVSRAGTLRSMAVPGMAPVPRGEQPDPAAIADRMLALAGKARAR